MGEKLNHIFEIPYDAIPELSGLIQGSDSIELNGLRKELENRFGRNNKNILASQSSRIIQCKTCKGSGYRKNTFPDDSKNRLDVCEDCLGEGGIVEITSIRYERLTDNMRRRFAM